MHAEPCPPRCGLYLGVRELSVVNWGGPGGGRWALVFTGRRRRVGSLRSLLSRTWLTVGRRILPRPRVGRTVGRAGVGRWGAVGGVLTWRGGPWTSVALRTNNKQNISKLNKTKRCQSQNKNNYKQDRVGVPGYSEHRHGDTTNFTGSQDIRN